jgi:hypothetical protein
VLEGFSPGDPRPCCRCRRRRNRAGESGRTPETAASLRPIVDAMFTASSDLVTLSAKDASSDVHRRIDSSSGAVCRAYLLASDRTNRQAPFHGNRRLCTATRTGRPLYTPRRWQINETRMPSSVSNGTGSQPRPHPGCPDLLPRLRGRVWLRAVSPCRNGRQSGYPLPQGRRRLAACLEDRAVFPGTPLCPPPRVGRAQSRFS